MIKHGPTSSSLSHHKAIKVFTVLHFAFLSVCLVFIFEHELCPLIIIYTMPDVFLNDLMIV